MAAAAAAFTLSFASFHSFTFCKPSFPRQKSGKIWHTDACACVRVHGQKDRPGLPVKKSTQTQGWKKAWKSIAAFWMAEAFRPKTYWMLIGHSDFSEIGPLPTDIPIVRWSYSAKLYLPSFQIFFLKVVDTSYWVPSSSNKDWGAYSGFTVNH